MTGDLVETRVTTRRYAAIFFLDNLTDMIMTGMFKIRVKARDIQNPGYRREGCWMPWPEEIPGHLVSGGPGSGHSLLRTI